MEKYIEEKEKLDILHDKIKRILNVGSNQNPADNFLASN